MGRCLLACQKRGYFSKAFSTWGLNLKNGPYSKTYTPQQLVAIKKAHEESVEAKAAVVSRGACVCVTPSYTRVHPLCQIGFGYAAHVYQSFLYVFGNAARAELQAKMRLSRRSNTDPRLEELLGADPFASFPDDGAEEVRHPI